MVNLKSSETFESKVVSGVRFTLRRLGKMRQAKRDLSIFEELWQYRTACRRAVELLRSAGYTVAEDGTYTRTSPDPIAPEVEIEITNIDDQITMLLRAHIMPAALKASLLSLEGVVVDDVATTTAEALLAAGPDVNDLIEEIYRCSEKANKITTEEKELLKVAA